MNEMPTVLRRVTDLLAELSGADAAGLDDDALLAFAGQVESAGRRLDALRVAVAAEVVDRSRHELGESGLSRRNGHARGTHLLEHVCRISGAEAGRRARLGAAIAPRVSLSGERLPALFPTVAAALRSGVCGVDAAAHIVRCLGEAVPRCAVDDLVAAEGALVAASATVSADLVADQARVWRDHLDTDGTEPRADRQHAARSFTIGRERDDGMTPFSGLADPVSAGTLRAAFAAYRRKPAFARGHDAGVGTGAGSGAGTDAGARTGADEADADGIEGDLDVISDERTFAQREFDTFMGLVRGGLGADTTVVPGGRASVVATVRLDDLHRGVGGAWLDGIRERIPMHAVDQLLCDAGVEIAITNDDGALLALTAKTPLFTRRQRRALAARDGGCVWPGCTAPAHWTDAHHVIERSEGGPTDVSNGVLLCPAHHRMLHHSDHRMKMIRGRPHLLAPPPLDPQQRWRRLGRSRHELLARLRSDAEPGAPPEARAAAG